MIIKEWLEEVTAVLLKYSPTPRLDAEVLLCHVLVKDRAEILAHGDDYIQQASLKKLKTLVARRQKHEPIAYILGKSEFYGREFFVDKNVLVPRPESETMIDLAKQVIGDRLEVRENTACIDVGTGSGSLAITMQSEMPEIKVTGVDISSDCLKIARMNATKLRAKVKFYQGDLLTPFSNLKPPTSNLVILANLPYVPSDYAINDAAKHEPKLALFGGTDGLDLYRRLFRQSTKVIGDGLEVTVLTESLDFQHEELAKIAKNAGFKQTNKIDLIQVFAKT